MSPPKCNGRRSESANSTPQLFWGAHIGEALLAAGDALTNLHVADSNRGALGDGSMDLDTIIMALYVLGYNRIGHIH